MDPEDSGLTSAKGIEFSHNCLSTRLSVRPYCPSQIGLGEHGDRSMGGIPKDVSAGNGGGADDLGIDGYDGFAPIGQGGFGSVYRCRQIAFDRTVAIKVLATAGLGAEITRRFERECRAVGALSGHPYILTVHDSGITRWGKPFIVMDFMSRGSLANHLAQTGPLNWQEAIEVGIKIASGVDAAHAANILHRDIKPQNILVSSYGEPKLADFGISTIPSGYQTHSGVITASVAHAPPEVLNGGRATEASDIYALASTVYSMIGGSPPFVMDGDESIATLITRTLTQRVPSLRPLAPDSVCRVLEKAMEKDPEDRYQSAHAFAEALRSAQQREGVDLTPILAGETHSVSAPAADASGLRFQMTQSRVRPHAIEEPSNPGRKRYRRSLMAAAGVFLILAGSGAALAFRGGGSPSPKGNEPKPHVTSTLAATVKSKPVEIQQFTVTYKRSKGSFGGQLRSSEKTCVKHRTVSLKEVGRAHSQVVRSTKSDASGGWSISRPNAEGRFFAFVPRKSVESDSLVCKPARSTRVSVDARSNVKKRPGPGGSTGNGGATSTIGGSGDSSVDIGGAAGDGGGATGSGETNSGGSSGGGPKPAKHEPKEDRSPPPDASDPSPGG